MLRIKELIVIWLDSRLQNNLLKLIVIWSVSRLHSNLLNSIVIWSDSRLHKNLLKLTVIWSVSRLCSNSDEINCYLVEFEASQLLALKDEIKLLSGRIPGFTEN